MDINDPNSADTNDISMMEAVVFNKISGVIILSESKHGYCGINKYNLNNHCTMGTNKYPMNMEKFLWLLRNYNSANNNHTSNLVEQ